MLKAMLGALLQAKLKQCLSNALHHHHHHHHVKTLLRQGKNLSPDHLLPPKGAANV